MLRRLLIVVVLATLPAVAGGQVEIVVDASAVMLQRVGGTSIHARVREAVIAVAAETAALRKPPTIRLRLAGGHPDHQFFESCAVTGREIAVDLSSRAWIGDLDAVGPRGLRPLIGTVLEAMQPGEETAKNSRVVIVTSGADQCGRSPQEVAAALAVGERPIDLRVVGLGLEQTVLDTFGAIPIRNAVDAEELLAALRWAVLDIEDAPRPTGVLDLRFPTSSGDPTEMGLQLHDLATDTIHEHTANGPIRIDLPTGRFRLELDGVPGGRVEYRNLLITASAEIVAEIDTSVASPAAVDLVPVSSVAGTGAWIDVAGWVPDDAGVLVVDTNGHAVGLAIDPRSTGGWTTMPTRAGNYELLVIGATDHGLRRVLARQAFAVASGSREITAPDDVGIGDDLAVSWSGPLVDGDFVGLAPSGGGLESVLSCAGAGVAPQAKLTAPMSESELDVVYVDGATLEVTGRRSLVVTPPQASLDAPTSVSVGERINVVWSGPENREDFLSLATPESPDDAYVEWARIDEGNPITLEAPMTAGDFELRYVDGEDLNVLARTPIEIMPIPLELRAPATVRAGRRFEVEWTGPASHGDFLAISKTSFDPDRYLDWASTTTGSPITLAAPMKPGIYEVRYVTGGGSAIAVRAAIEVLP